MELKQKLILIRGLPGSGKSTLAKKLIEENPHFKHYEADMYFVDRDGVYNFVGSNIGKAHHWCFSATETALQKGHTVIVSNTTTTQKEAQPYIDLAKRYSVELEIITLRENYGNIHNVPQETINKMQSRFVDELKTE